MLFNGVMARRLCLGVRLLKPISKSLRGRDILRVCCGMDDEHKAVYLFLQAKGLQCNEMMAHVRLITRGLDADTDTEEMAEELCQLGFPIT